MRYLLAAVMAVAVSAPSVGAGNSKRECKGRCDASYRFCMSRAVNSTAKRRCKSDRKNCSRGCNALKQ